MTKIYPLADHKKKKSLKKALKLKDSLANSFRPAGKPHWCSIHEREYNGDFYKECPDCFREKGDFHSSSRD